MTCTHIYVIYMITKCILTHLYLNDIYIIGKSSLAYALFKERTSGQSPKGGTPPNFTKSYRDNGTSPNGLHRRKSSINYIYY